MTAEQPNLAKQLFYKFLLVDTYCIYAAFLDLIQIQKSSLYVVIISFCLFVCQALRNMSER